MAAISKTAHERNIREMLCVVTHSPVVTLHHCHGGSMSRAGWHVGMGQKQNPFLVIPLAAHLHIGSQGIDSGVGVKTWETRYGEQMALLRRVNEQLDYDIWELAKEWERTHRWKSGRTGRSG